MQQERLKLAHRKTFTACIGLGRGKDNMSLLEGTSAVTQHNPHPV